MTKTLRFYSYGRYDLAMKILLSSLLSVSIFFPISGFGKLVWDTRAIETNAGIGQSTVTASYPFHVVDQGTTILAVKPSCGCTTVTLEKTSYEVGESGSIDVIFNTSNRTGLQRKSIRLTTDDPSEKNIVLSLSVDIDQALTVEPRFVFWSKQDRNPEVKTVTLETSSKRNVRIKSVVCDTDFISTKLKGKATGGYALLISPVMDENNAFGFERAVIEISILINGRPYPAKTKIHVFLK